MKVTDSRKPVRSSWFAEQGLRLDAASYLSGSFAARKTLEALPTTEPLSAVTSRIYNGPQFGRTYVTDPVHGVPFLGSTDMLEVDFTSLPLLRRKDAESSRLAYLEVRPGMTLISCSGTVGRMAYTRSDMAGFWSSQHIMKVVAAPDKILSGYLYAFLRSSYGVPIITGAAYGGIIQHIEPEHITGLPVPRLGDRIEGEIHELIEEAARLRSDFQARLVAATEDLFRSAGLPELIDIRWHEQPRDTGFQVRSVGQTTMRALNFAPRAQRLLDALRSVPHHTLGNICAGGQLASGVRFKRHDTDPGLGVQLIGQRQGFWLRPEGRWISAHQAPTGIFADDETVMIASQGTLGENEVYCRAILATGSWLDYAYTQHFLRVVSGDTDFPGAYLFAFLRSEVAFRLLRSMSVGGKQQDIHPVLRAQLPIPECTSPDRVRIAEIVRNAYRDRDEADRKEDRALELLDEAIRGAAR